ncbi:MAG: cob(I)yrinic acid a,c-diamide adenosyltransferase [Nanoarchaeota archaeon]
MGEVYVFTGNGEGKTSAALGHALRAIGYNKKVVIIQFLKGRKDIGEVKFKNKNFKLYQFGRPEFVTKVKGKHKFMFKMAKISADKIRKEDIKLANNALKFAEKEMKKKPFLLVLDEVSVALYFRLIKLKDVLKLVKKLPKETNLILTGRNAHRELIKKADVVTSMNGIKTPAIASRGVEY